MLLFSCEGDGVAENDSSAPSVDSDGVATCTVTFDIRGELTTEEVEYDSTIERPEDPDLGEDYIFYGWYYRQAKFGAPRVGFLYDECHRGYHPLC